VAEILIVDDDPEVLKVMSAILEQHDVQSDAAVDGKQALNKLCVRTVENRMYDAIILDINMPILNGWDVLHAVKNNPLWRDVNVVVLTGVATSPEEVSRVTEYDGVLIDKSSLFQKIIGKLLERII